MTISDLIKYIEEIKKLKELEEKSEDDKFRLLYLESINIETTDYEEE